MTTAQRAFAAALAVALSGCSSCGTPAFRDCAPIDPGLLNTLPERLSETGLFTDMATEELAEGVLPFAPRFELWTDGATKRRWIKLPPNAQIDTSEPNAWRFPAGTRLWKELSRDGVRVETRLLLKHGEAPDAWTPVAYVWGADVDARAAPEGRTDALGTPHDVPSAADCMGCHAGVESGVLGFSAIQLVPEGTDDRAGLAELNDAGWLAPPVEGVAIPGDAATRAALGYLHANCSHCHNATRPEREGPRCFDPESSLDFSLRVGALTAPETTGTFRTAIGTVIVPGDADDSEVMVRLRSRDPWWGMPALGTELVDDDGARTIEAWIRGL